MDPSNLIVRLGEQRVGANAEALPHYEIPVSAVVGHPEFADGSLFHDTAILMLSVAAPSGQPHVAPICLPASSEPQISECVVTGWGHDTLSGSIRESLPFILPNCLFSFKETRLYVGSAKL